MKVDYEELYQYWRAAMSKTPGEWEDAIESILDAVPDVVKEHAALEAENADLKERLKAADLAIAGLLRDLKGEMEAY